MDKNYHLNKWRKQNDKKKEYKGMNEINIQELKVHEGKTIKRVEKYEVIGHPYGFKFVFTDGTFWGMASTEKFETERIHKEKNE